LHFQHDFVPTHPPDFNGFQVFVFKVGGKAGSFNCSVIMTLITHITVLGLLCIVSGGNAAGWTMLGGTPSHTGREPHPKPHTSQPVKKWAYKGGGEGVTHS